MDALCYTLASYGKEVNNHESTGVRALICLMEIRETCVGNIILFCKAFSLYIYFSFQDVRPRSMRNGLGLNGSAFVKYCKEKNVH